MWFRFTLVTSILVLALAFLASLATQTVSNADLARQIDSLAIESKVPGLAVMVVSSEEIQFSHVTGTIKFEGDTKASLTNNWHLGSCTKAFTAMEIGYLVDSGKVNLDWSFQKLFEGDNVDESLRKVTLRQLLGHRSGIQPNHPWSRISSTDKPVERRRTEILKHILANPTSEKLKGTYAYSNSGYFVAGSIAEKFQGKSIEALMTSSFNKIGLSKFGFGPTSSDDPWPHRKQTPLDPTGAYYDNDIVSTAAGRAHMPIGEWSKILAEHLKASQGKPHKLPKSYINELMNPPKGWEYTMGWLILNPPTIEGPVFAHSGSNTFNYAAVLFAPSIDKAILICTNTADDGQTAVNKILPLLINLEP